MPNRFSFLFCVALATTSGLACGPVMADPLADSSSDTPVLPDPVPDPHIVFPKGLATADVAVTSPALSATPAEPRGAGPGCSALNPCAVASPALDRMDARPPNPAMLARVPKKKSAS